MRTIVHLSDVHFGRVDYEIVNRLIKTVAEIKPHLVVVSGDLTQRARSSQFIEARAFLDALPQPQIIVPGNHDIPLYNVLTRFGRPLDKYKKYITNDLRPVHIDDEIVVLGVNTARSLTIKDGRINANQIAWIREKLCAIETDKIKIIVTHHPFDLPIGFEERDLIGRASLAMKMLAECGADVFLAGHLHVSNISHTATRYKIKNHSALVVQAGTATSTRGRGEANSFNVIRVEQPLLTVERFEWEEALKRFRSAESQNYTKSFEGWEIVSDK